MSLSMWAADAGVAVATVLAMEMVAWAAHRYVMHGWGWRLHQSHHQPPRGWWEANDLYAVLPAAASVVLFVAAPSRAHWLFWIAIGLTAYGVLYAVMHDGLVHRRWPLQHTPRWRYARRLIQAHRLHHATPGRDGAVSFGFLYAPPVPVLAARLRAIRHQASLADPDQGGIGPVTGR